MKAGSAGARRRFWSSSSARRSRCARNVSDSARSLVASDATPSVLTFGVLPFGGRRSNALLAVQLCQFRETGAGPRDRSTDRELPLGAQVGTVMQHAGQ